MANERILIVEDERITAKAIADLVNSLNYIALNPVSTGEDAIKKAEELHPDLVLMDIVLEGKMDGITAANEITKKLDIPVIFITAYEDSDTLSRAKIAEPYGYIVKPVVDEKDIRPSIELTLHNHKIKMAMKQHEKTLAEITRKLESVGNSPQVLDDLKGMIKGKTGSSESENEEKYSRMRTNLIQILDALSNPDRFLIFSLVQSMQLNTSQIQTMLEKSQSTSSHHIKVLEDARLIQGVKKGKFTYYSANKPVYKEFVESWSKWTATIYNWTSIGGEK